MKNKIRTKARLKPLASIKKKIASVPAMARSEMVVTNMAPDAATVRAPTGRYWDVKVTR